MELRELDERERRLHALLGSRAGRGLEIGPLCSPIFVPGEAQIQYLDLQSAAELREHYRNDPGVRIDDIVDPDFVLIGPEGPRTLPVAVGDAAPFDWVVASHVIEHVPDLIGWLRQVADILADGGRLLLAVPDRRFTFDAGRPETTVGEMLLAHESGDVTPSVRAVYDHFGAVVDVDILAAWQGHIFGPESRLHDLTMAMGHVNRRRQGIYVDCHVWLFTPHSLAQQLNELGALGLCDLVVEGIDPTTRDQQEFYAVLRRIPRAASEKERDAAFAGSVRAVEADEPNSVTAGARRAMGPGTVELTLSAREAQVLGAKRAAITRARGLVRRVRARVGAGR